MLPGAGVVKPNDLAVIVDPAGLGEGGAGDIDGDEAAAAIEEARVLAPSEYCPTIWPLSLIPKAPVIKAPGTLIVVKLPPL